MCNALLLITELKPLKLLNTNSDRMKKWAPLLLLAGLAFPAAGQSFKTTPNDTLIATAPAGGITVYDIFQLNTGSTNIIFHWNPVAVQIPSGWDYSMCDKGTCYPGIPGGTMSPVSPGDSGFLGFNVIPNSLGGTSVVRIYVYADSFVNDGDTLTWIINSDFSSGLSNSNVPNMNFYPNPVKDILSFTKKLRSVQVFDIMGRIVFNSKNEAWFDSIDMSAMQPGIYTLKGLNEFNQPVTVKITRI